MTRCSCFYSHGVAVFTTYSSSLQCCYGDVPRGRLQSARCGAAAQAAYCDRMLHPEETTNLADFKLPNPDTRLVVFGDAVFKLKYKLR